MGAGENGVRSRLTENRCRQLLRQLLALAKFRHDRGCKGVKFRMPGRSGLQLGNARRVRGGLSFLLLFCGIIRQQ